MDIFDDFYESEEYSVSFADNKEVMVKRYEVNNDALVSVEAGTNGLHGGDSGYGGRTYVSLRGEYADFGVCINGGNVIPFEDIKIVAGGDAELKGLIHTLRWAANRLEEQVNELKKEPSCKQKSQERFNAYINELVTMFKEKKSLRGMSDIVKFHKVRAINKDVFFGSGVINSTKHIPMSYTNELYAYVLAREFNKEIPRYVEK